MNKLKTISEVLDQVSDGSIIAFGGNVLHRSPIKVAKEMAVRKIKDLHIVKTAIAMEADILCAFHCAAKVSAGFVGYESEFGLCNYYRKGVQSGEVIAQEHACYSVIAALRAAGYGIPFLPIRGFEGSDLPAAMGFKTVIDPYGKEQLIAIKAICPDYAFIHVQKADRRGNAQIIGPVYEDLIVARSAKHLVLTCEEIVEDDYFGPERKADLSEVLVQSVIELKYGAKPGACAACYDLDREEISRFKACKTEAQLWEVIQ